MYSTIFFLLWVIYIYNLNNSQPIPKKWKSFSFSPFPNKKGCHLFAQPFCLVLEGLWNQKQICVCEREKEVSFILFLFSSKNIKKKKKKMFLTQKEKKKKRKQKKKTRKSSQVKSWIKIGFHSHEFVSIKAIVIWRVFETYRWILLYSCPSWVNSIVLCQYSYPITCLKNLNYYGQKHV